MPQAVDVSGLRIVTPLAMHCVKKAAVHASRRVQVLVVRDRAFKIVDKKLRREGCDARLHRDRPDRFNSATTASIGCIVSTLRAGNPK